MARTALLVVIALATAALLVPTGAVPFTDTVNEDLSMAPAEGPNGDYAVQNEDGEIELRLTGANPAVDGDGLDPDAVTPLSRVFTITYTGDGTADVWLTDDSEDVRFYQGDDTDDSLEGSDNSVTLEPSESLAVGLLVDTRGDTDVESAETFTVHAEGPDSGDGDEDESDETDSADDDESDDDGEENDSEDDDGDDDDSRIETPTPVPPTETDNDTSIGGGQGETPTPTAEPGDEAPSDDGDGPLELGGIGLGPLLAIAATLVALLIGLATYRQYS